MTLVKHIKEKWCPWWIKTSRARLKRTGIILMYHRVNDLPSDPWYLNVSPKNFDEQMRIIKKYGNLLQMHEMGGDLSKFSPVSDQIAVTFDDGFADNFYNAKPVLEKYEVPATFYISSNAIESQQEFWWDRLSNILLSSSLPEVFEMNINNTQYRWILDKNIQESAVYFLPPFNSVLSQKQLLFSIARVIRPLAFHQQNELVDQVKTWSGQKTALPCPYLPMSLTELNQMANVKLFEIGAHTVHHPLLSAWSFKKQEEEILEGRQTLEKWINKKITSFAYPYGDYSNETLDILEKLEFHNACTVVEGPVRRNMNCFLLPRYMVFNWNGDVFEQKLREWLSQRIKG